MIDCGIVLFVIGVLLACVGPAEKAFMSRRAGPVVGGHLPCARPSPVLEQLAAEADAAIERDDLTRGVAATARTYRRAARPR